MKCDQPCQHCGSRAGHARDERAVDGGGARRRREPRRPRLPGDRAHRRRGLPAPGPPRDRRATSPVAASASACRRAGAPSRRSGRGRSRDAGLTGARRLGRRARAPCTTSSAATPAATRPRSARSTRREVRPGGLGQHAGATASTTTSSARPATSSGRTGSRRGRCSSRCPWAAPPTGRSGSSSPGWWWTSSTRWPRSSARPRRARRRPPTPPASRSTSAVGNNIGYYGPHELTLRSRPGGQEAHWRGCRAGINVIGIESDGEVKGCPSLPTAPYVGGNVRDLSLARHLGARRGDPLLPRPHRRRALGLLQDLLLRRDLPRRLLVDGALHPRPAREQPLLLPPRDPAPAPGHARAARW